MGEFQAIGPATENTRWYCGAHNLYTLSQRCGRESARGDA